MLYLKFIVIVMALFFSCDASFAEMSKDKTEISPASQENQLVKCVDHILLMPGQNKAKTLYDFFSEELGMPAAWPYKNYGVFSSGAVYFGNVSVEIIESNEMKGTEPKIAGIAFEPKSKTADLISGLEKNKIAFDGPQPFEVNFGNVHKKLWTSTYIKDILPGHQIFFCEYHMFVPAEQKIKLNEKFVNADGGKLKVKKIKEIVISLKNLKTDISKWHALTVPYKADSENNIYFNEGPALKFINGEENKIESLIVHVESLEKILPSLHESKLFGQKTANGVELNKEKTFGVSVVLE